MSIQATAALALPFRYCAYIDHESCTMAELGRAHSSWHATGIDANSALVLSTCQRFEIYDAIPHPALPDMPLSSRARIVNDAPLIHQRLAEIAAGVRSQILGERFVWHQVKAAAEGLDRPSPEARAVDEALDLARRLRKFYGLDAPVDYPEVTLRLLDRHADRAELLVVVGGGFLARAVAEAGQDRYRRVLMVTRSPKRLRSRLRPAARAEACRIADLELSCRDTPAHVVLATTNITAEYRLELLSAITDPRCLGTIDLCAHPIRTEPERRYICMYDEVFLDLIAGNNDRVTAAAAAVRSGIAAYYRI